MKLLNTTISPVYNGFYVVLYFKNLDRVAFYCAAYSPLGDGRYRFYIRDAHGDVSYRIVLKESDFVLIHVINFNRGSFRLHAGTLTDLAEGDYKLIRDSWERNSQIKFTPFTI